MSNLFNTQSILFPYPTQNWVMSSGELLVSCGQVHQHETALTSGLIVGSSDHLGHIHPLWKLAKKCHGCTLKLAECKPAVFLLGYPVCWKKFYDRVWEVRAGTIFCQVFDHAHGSNPAKVIERIQNSNWIKSRNIISELWKYKDDWCWKICLQKRSRFFPIANASSKCPKKNFHS